MAAVRGELLWTRWATGEEEMQMSYFATIWATPVLALLLMVLWLRVIWRSPAAPKPSTHTAVAKAAGPSTPRATSTEPMTPERKNLDPEFAAACRDEMDTPPKAPKVAAVGSEKMSTPPKAHKVPAEGKADQPKAEMLKAQLLEAGESVASELVPYTDPWTTTFDFVFVVGYAIGLACLLAVTYLVCPEVLCLAELANLGVKFAVMLGSSIFGGLLARRCCIFDERGYVAVDERGKTKARVKGFKVNYTRKIQHFCAYAAPFMIPSPVASDSPVPVAWGNMATLLGFIIVVKPLRECHTFFMMQFNSFDRPEDRPFTLKWIVLGDILPGMVVIMVFYWVFAPYTVNGYPATGLCYIFAMVCGFGDGLAEPVGVHVGVHKYEVSAIMAGGDARKYQRSFEGSCCVALFTYIFVAQKWYLFVNASAFWLTVLVLPPMMAWAEARSPHTMDTPFLFLVGGVWLWLALYMPPISILEPLVY